MDELFQDNTSLIRAKEAEQAGAASSGTQIILQCNRTEFGWGGANCLDNSWDGAVLCTNGVGDNTPAFCLLLNSACTASAVSLSLLPN